MLRNARFYAVAAVFSIIAGAASAADPVTLLIDNDAGMVTIRDGYTQTECDAAALLLNGTKPDSNQSSGVIILNSACPFVGGCQSTPQSHTPRLTRAQCIRPTKAQ